MRDLPSLLSSDPLVRIKSHGIFSLQEMKVKTSRQRDGIVRCICGEHYVGYVECNDACTEGANGETKLADGAALGGKMKDCFVEQSFFRCGGAGGLLYQRKRSVLGKKAQA